MISTAVILAAGEGRRLRETTHRDIPKQLYPIKGEELISRIMWSLYNVGIQRFVVVLGWERHQLVRKIVPLKIPGTQLQFAANDRWHTRGTGISLQTAEPLVKDERAFICCMGDHLFEPEIAERLIRSYEVDHPWHAQMAVDYRKNLPPSAHGTKVQMNLVEPHMSWVHTIGRDLTVHEAVDAGLFVFPSLIFRSILLVQGRTGDCDLCEAVDEYAMNIGVKGIDVSPWNWANINDLKSVQAAEADYRLCP